MTRHWTFIALYLLGLVLAFSAVAQSPDTIVVRSRTDQFIIYGSHARSGFVPQPMLQSRAFGEGQLYLLMPQSLIAPTNSRIHLDPALTAVSCERIKEALLNELGERDTGGRKIHIRLNPRLKQRDLLIGAALYEKGWIFSLELPSETEKDFFTATILNTLLLDLANRHGADSQIEIPKWLVSGLIAHLQSTSLRSLALQQNLQFTRERVRVDPLANAREQFRDNVPLTFDEMSWPETLSTNKLALFRNSSQLFVHELLRLKHGRECLREFLVQLPRHKNWQFAFLSAFKPHFSHLLQVEKWWALSYINFTGRDVSNLLSEEESWKKLKAALDVSVQVHLTTNRLPVAAAINLQEVILQWENTRQELALQKALGQLRAMRMRVHPEYVAIVDEYKNVLETYLGQRSKATPTAGKNQLGVNAVLLKKSTCRQLDTLDERRSSLRKGLAQGNDSTSPAAATTKASR